MAKPLPYPDDSQQNLLYKIASLFRRSSVAQSEQSVSRVDTVGGTTACVARPERISGYIQNLGTNKLYVKEGPGASTADFSSVLTPCTAQDDGTGGVHNMGSYNGLVTVAGTAPRYVVVERYTPDV